MNEFEQPRIPVQKEQPQEEVKTQTWAPVRKEGYTTGWGEKLGSKREAHIKGSNKEIIIADFSKFY